MDALVAHYHEVGLKGRNRGYFEDTLARNLRRALRGTGYGRVRRAFGRIIAGYEDSTHLEIAAERAARVFGVANVGAGRWVTASLDEIEAAALDVMVSKPFTTFAVRTRRTYSSLAASSQELNIRIGKLIQDHTEAPVDLRNPSATLHIELFGNQGVIYRNRTAGPGGLPVGVSGRMVALLSGGIDSPVAAWRMARRGVDVELLHFHGQPFTDPSSARQAAELAEVLSRWQLKTLLHLVPLADVQREIVTHAPASLRTVLYRRMMLRIAAALAAERRAQALVTGDSLGQVASQTIENLVTVDAAVEGLPVIRPLIGMDKAEIISESNRIGTYPISVRAHQDCCVLFQPRSPATRSTPSEAAEAEAAIDIDAAVGKALAGMETRVVELPPAT